jgi:hypothetical protein
MNFTRLAQFPGRGFSKHILVSVVLAGAMVAGLGHAEPGAEPAEVPTADERIRVLEEQVATLAAELSENRISEAVPVDSEFDPVWGVGPSASKVYSQDAGLSIGGYGEVRFRHDSTDDDIFDALRAVLYVGYKFSDSWVLNSEIEFEHAGGSDVFVEFLNLDYLHSDALNFRVGLILIPMGFVNQLHEPTFYYGASRPEVEKTIIPSTWRENGAGFFGRFGDRVTYQAYAVSSFEGSKFNASGFRPGRQKGMEALTNDWSVVVRTDVAAMSGLNLGASVYYGNQGQDQSVGDLPVGSLSTAIYEFHAEYQRYGFTVRGLFSQAFVDNPDSLNQGIRAVIDGTDASAAAAAAKGGFLAESLLGGYVEFAYDVMPNFLPETEQSLEPFFRYERLNTQSRMQSATFARTLKYDRHLYTVGLQYQPISQLVFKLDYRWITQQSNGASLAKQVEFGAGYVF